MRPSYPLRFAAVMAVLVLGLAAAASAQTGVLFVKNNRVSVGIDPPTATLDVLGTASTVGTGNAVVKLQKSGSLAFQLDDTNLPGFWNFAVTSGESEFRISKSGTGASEFTVDQNGNVFIRGACSEGGNPGTGSCADYVFEPDYELRSLGELDAFIRENKHLPNVPSADEIRTKGLSIQQFQGRLLEKIEELTLYTLQQEAKIEELQAQVASLSARVE